LTGYRIYYGTSPTSLTQSIDVTGATVTSYIVFGLASGTYYFAVAAINSFGTASTPTNVISKTIP